jgi:protein TonB
VRQQLQKLDAAGRFYPAEAIARGLEGEVQVLLVIDENGQVVATRLEQGSGHAILDEAALRAARSLKSLPADAPRQTVLPIRFRLK